MVREYKVLVCGGRDFHDRAKVEAALNGLHATQTITALCQGGADGADRLAAEWAWSRNIPVTTFNADWRRYGKRAGPIRNKRMLEEFKPSAAVAFPGGAGTADMVRRAEAIGLVVWKLDLYTTAGAVLVNCRENGY